jgi:hypothetical protein
MITHGHVHVNEAHKTPQFWLLWAVLCLNVSAGIGVLGMASPMLQEVFGGKLIGLGASLGQLSTQDKVRVASIAAGFAGLLSLFNIAGRIFWASLSDKIGRQWTYIIFFALGLLLYAAVPFAGGTLKSVAIFVSIFCVILTMYGGGFATIPAYLADLSDRLEGLPLTDQKALIQLSLRYKSDDQLFFSLFHEAAHVLLHPKRAEFVEGVGQDTPAEREADRFAADHLIPPEEYERLLANPPSVERITACAERIGVAPGIVVGRLHHDGHVRFHEGNGLKRRLRWLTAGRKTA